MKIIRQCMACQHIDICWTLKVNCIFYTLLKYGEKVIFVLMVMLHITINRKSYNCMHFVFCQVRVHLEDALYIVGLLSVFSKNCVLLAGPWSEEKDWMVSGKLRQALGLF